MKKVTTILFLKGVAYAVTMLLLSVYSSAQISSTYSSAAPWHKFGSVYANSGIQKYVIPVGTGNAYKTLKITVQDGPAEIIDIIVTFNSGDQSKIAVKSVLHANESREFNFSKQQSIRKIEVNYNAVFRNGKIASLSVWGI